MNGNQSIRDWAKGNILRVLQAQQVVFRTGYRGHLELIVEVRDKGPEALNLFVFESIVNFQMINKSFIFFKFYKKARSEKGLKKVWRFVISKTFILLIRKVSMQPLRSILWNIHWYMANADINADISYWKATSCWQNVGNAKFYLSLYFFMFFFFSKYRASWSIFLLVCRFTSLNS